jgi:hypothetical protein
LKNWQHFFFRRNSFGDSATSRQQETLSAYQQVTARTAPVKNHGCPQMGLGHRRCSVGVSGAPNTACSRPSLRSEFKRLCVRFIIIRGARVRRRSRPAADAPVGRESAHSLADGQGVFWVVDIAKESCVPVQLFAPTPPCKLKTHTAANDL